MAQAGKLILAGVLLTTAVSNGFGAVDGENPYNTIVTRNAFRLSAPPVINTAPVEIPLSVDAEFEGTSTIGEETRGWFIVRDKNSQIPPVFMDLSPGQRMGKLEVINFDRENGTATVKLGGGTTAKEVVLHIKPPIKSTVNLSNPQSIPMGGFQQPNNNFNPANPIPSIPAPGGRPPMGSLNGSSAVAGGNFSTVAGGGAPQFQPVPNGVNNGVVTFPPNQVPGMAPQSSVSTVANNGLRTIPQRPVRTVGNPNVVEITENAPATIQEAHQNMEALRASTANQNYPPLPPTPYSR
ncbi:MAG: hypothetical protein JWN25_1788 [Verrucomicrobiales bacterium]|nr:hypothetical protein [Verrucomicrobiales bacterium]